MTQAGTGMMNALVSAGAAVHARGGPVVTTLDVFRACLQARTDVHVDLAPDSSESPPGSHLAQEKPIPEDRWGRIEALAALREAAWLAAVDRPWTDRRPWDAQARPAVEDAIDMGAERGVFGASGAHLLAALIAPFDGAVPDALRAAGVSVDSLVETLEASGALDLNSVPWTPTFDMLALRAGLAVTPWPVRPFAALYRTAVRPAVGWVGYALLHEARRQAVRLGHPTTNPVHLLVAAADLAEQFDTAYAVGPLARRTRPRPELLEAVRPGHRLIAGLEQPFAHLAVNLGDGGGPPAAEQPPIRRDGPAFTAAAMAAIDRAVRGPLAPEPGRLGAAPLVAAVLADPDDAVTALLAARGLDPSELRT
ncbi:Clp protease N-terminal domain-containing protein [Dactylosporangium sp. NPDC049140]|uniref:Clp protease N-terminal domain-containing protein n=1 Tax=Dactylosporangium sp. NPDC049140 TaxID=3155647 RepID=UPI0033F43DB3